MNDLCMKCWVIDVEYYHTWCTFTELSHNCGRRVVVEQQPATQLLLSARQRNILPLFKHLLALQIQAEVVEIQGPEDSVGHLQT